MSLRTSLILLVLLVMVAGSLVFSQFRPSSPSEVEDEDVLVITVSPEDIRQVTISYRGEMQNFLQKGDYWYFDDAYQTPVDLDRWGGIVPLLSGPESRRVLLEEAGDLSPFGLEEPQGLLSVQLTGDRGFQYLLGNRTEDGVSHYVQLEGSPQIYLVDAIWGDVITRLITEVPYPKWYYQSPSERASELEVTYQETKVSFVKNAKRVWQVNTSTRADERPPVDDQRWQEEVIPLLSGPSVQYQAAPELEDAAQYGLEEPFAVVRIEFGTFEESGLEVFRDREWSLGKKTEDGEGYYAKLFGFPPVVVVDAEWVEGLLAIAESPPYVEGATQEQS